MIVGVCELELIIHEAFSLKSKRKVIKRTIERTKNKFKISIAEVGCQDLWNRSKIGICLAGSDRRIIDSTLDKVINFVENLNSAEIFNARREIIHFNDFY